MPSLKKKDMATGAGGTGGGISLPSGSEWSMRADRAIQLLDEWMKDGPEYDDETWPELKKALDENRPSPRKLFDGD
ncbi:MAG: hypothetical protein WCX65_13710 [bacterium]